MSEKKYTPDQLIPTPNQNFELKGDFYERTTNLTEEGTRRLQQNGLVIVVAPEYHGGVGATTTADHLAQALGTEFLSTGNIMRKMAEDKGFYGDSGLNDFLQDQKDNPNLDYELDDYAHAIAAETAKESPNTIIIDSKMMAFLWPIFANTKDSPVFLTGVVTAQEDIANPRLLSRENAKRESKGQTPLSLNDISPMRDLRIEDDVNRYAKVYPHINYQGPQDISNVANFPPFDTSEHQPYQVAAQIIQSLLKIPEINSHLTRTSN